MYHIIVNPIAGGRRARKNLEIVKRLLAERGVGYNVYETSGAGDAKEIAARLTARDVCKDSCYSCPYKCKYDT